MYSNYLASASTSPSSSMECLIGVVLPRLFESETDLNDTCSLPKAEISRNHPQSEHRRVYTSDQYIQIDVMSASVDYICTQIPTKQAKTKTKHAKKKKTTRTKKKTKHKHRGSKKAVIHGQDIRQIRRIVHIDRDIDSELRLSVSITRYGSKREISVMVENVGNHKISNLYLKWYRGSRQKTKKITIAKVIKAQNYGRRIFNIFEDTDSYDSDKGLEVRVVYGLKRLDTWMDIENILRKSNRFYLSLD